MENLDINALKANLDSINSALPHHWLQSKMKMRIE